MRQGLGVAGFLSGQGRCPVQGQVGRGLSFGDTDTSDAAIYLGTSATEQAAGQLAPKGQLYVTIWVRDSSPER
jgi:hypothetical protein